MSPQHDTRPVPDARFALVASHVADLHQEAGERTSLRVARRPRRRPVARLAAVHGAFARLSGAVRPGAGVRGSFPAATRRLEPCATC